MAIRTILAILLLGFAVSCSGGSRGPSSATAPAATRTAAPSLPASATAAAVNSPTAEPVAGSSCGSPLLTSASADATALAKLAGRIAFTCEGDIWTMRPDGSDQRRLTRQPAIAWDRVRLYRVPDTQPPNDDERLQLELALNSSPRWLPSGVIAFASIRDPLQLSAAAADGRRFFVGASEVYTVNADGSGERRVTSFNLDPGAYPGDDRTGCLRPDFCFAGLLRIRPKTASKVEQVLVADVIEIRFTECCFYTRLLSINPTIASLSSTASVVPDIPPAEVAALDWSADGGSYVVQRNVDLSDGGRNAELWLYSAAGRERVLTAGPGNTLVAAVAPALAPDGKTIAFCGWQDARAPAAVYSLVSGQPPRLLFALSKPPTSTVLTFVESQECAPRWSPDGRYLVTATGDGDVAAIEASGGHLIRLAHGGQPDWGP